jgi:predicted benzoate:H+ symporter BenE
VSRVHRRSQVGLLLAALVIVAAGFGIALVEMYRWPKGSIWGVAGAAVLLVALIRLVSRRPR